MGTQWSININYRLITFQKSEENEPEVTHD